MSEIIQIAHQAATETIANTVKNFREAVLKEESTVKIMSIGLDMDLYAFFCYHRFGSGTSCITLGIKDGEQIVIEGVQVNPVQNLTPYCVLLVLDNGGAFVFSLGSEQVISSKEAVKVDRY